MKLLKSEFGVNLRDAIDALMLPPSVQDARTLYEAMKVRYTAKICSFLVGLLHKKHVGEIRESGIRKTNITTQRGVLNVCY